MKKLGLLFIAVTLLTVAGCAQPANAPPQLATSTTATITASSLPPTTAPPLIVEQPDDIVFTPGGYAYRANVHQAGVPDRWTPIEVTDVTLPGEPNATRISYRSGIETRPGETHPNIVTVVLVNADPVSGPALDAAVTLVGSISWLTVTQDEGLWHDGDPARRGALILRMVVSDQAHVGKYDVQLEVKVNGRDCGAVPCTITVMN